MKVTIGMSCSINGLIAGEDGNEDFLSNRNYEIMLEFLKQYDCLVWGNNTYKNVKSWGSDYLSDLNNTKLVVFSKQDNESDNENVDYCNSLEKFKSICEENNFNKILVYGGAHINNLFLKNNLVDNIIINYNPYVLNKGINLFEGEYFEKKLSLDKVIYEQEGIVQVWFSVNK